MNKKTIITAAALSGVVAAGGLALTSTPAHAESKGQCHGVNSCKGKGDCHSKSHSCSGHNGCAGKGWKKMSQKECEHAILESAKKKGMFFKKG